MVAFQHPEGLNPFKRYRQASAIYRSTSRASNPAWYSNALDLPYRVFVHTDGTAIRCCEHVADQDSWSDLTDQLPDDLFEEAGARTFAELILHRARQHGAKSAGIILLLADDFATAEIKHDLDNPAALNELRAQIAVEPYSVLDDSSLPADEHTWRLLPYTAAEGGSIATAITLPRDPSSFLDVVRRFGIDRNFPLITRAVSAPLVALLALPEIFTGRSGNPFIVVLPYPRFTVLSFFNAHGDLVLLRTLQHRGHHRASNLHHAASTTADALEFEAPDILVLPMSAAHDDQLLPDLQAVFEKSLAAAPPWNRTRFHLAAHPSVPVEAAILTLPLDRPEDPPERSLHRSHFFSALHDEAWATEDFLPEPPATADVFPRHSEMKLLKAARRLRAALLILLVGFGCWSLFQIVNMMRKPEWAFEPSESQLLKRRLALLNQEKLKVNHLENLLEDRSKGWMTLEFLARLVPEDSGLQVSSMKHSMTPQKSPGQNQVGFVKQWKILGFARNDALKMLAELNTREGISAVFNDVARVTGSQAFRTDLPTRSIVVNVKTVENPRFQLVPPEMLAPGDETSFPYQFDLTVTQRFEANDPMALLTAKAP